MTTLLRLSQDGRRDKTSSMPAGQAGAARERAAANAAAKATRCDLPLVSDRADCPLTWAATRPAPIRTKAVVAIATIRRARPSPVASVTATTTTNSATSPDCEYE